MNSLGYRRIIRKKDDLINNQKKIKSKLVSTEQQWSG